MCMEENFDYVTIEKWFVWLILIKYKYLVSENSISLFVLMHWLVVAFFCQKFLAHNTTIAVKIDCKSSSSFFFEWMDNGKNAFLCSLVQLSFQILVMQISTSFFHKNFDVTTEKA